jgi:hypothetical protein
MRVAIRHMSAGVYSPWRLAVDHENAELRRQFLTAITPQDYNGVGLVAVRLTEALSATVFVPSVRLRAGEAAPPVGNTKDRLDRYIADSAPGRVNARLRKLARYSIEYGQHVKHRGTPARREAGIAADAVLLLRQHPSAPRRTVTRSAGPSRRGIATVSQAVPPGALDTTFDGTGKDDRTWEITVDGDGLVATERPLY